jgi:hypothetical protein
MIWALTAISGALYPALGQRTGCEQVVEWPVGQFPGFDRDTKATANRGGIRHPSERGVRFEDLLSLGVVAIEVGK